MHPVLLHLQRGFLETCVWFPPDFAPCVFPFADFALNPFAIINQSHEYYYLLSSGSSPSKLLNPGMVLRTLDTPVISEFCPLHR